jgi:hypothetical protein
MTSAPRLALVADVPGPAGRLLEALGRWAAAGPAAGRAAAYLEAGDGELRDGFQLTAGQAERLSRMLEHDLDS